MDQRLAIVPFTASAVAESIWEARDQAAVAHGRASLAIPGGRSPGPVLTTLAGMIEPQLRKKLSLLWLDERAVPEGHADRNDASTLAAWEEGGALPGQVLPMPAEQPDIAAAARLYAEQLAAATAGQPLSACLIGIGEDGHFASLFPDHPGLDELDPVFVCEHSPKPPALRLSMSLPVIRAATSKEVLVMGAAKGERIAQALEAGVQRQNPVSYLLATGARAWCDDAAMQTVGGSAT
jgi:6-phosphogluconolactonase